MWKRAERDPLLGHAGAVLTPREAKSPRQDTPLRPGSSTTGGVRLSATQRDVNSASAKACLRANTPRNLPGRRLATGQGAKSGCGQVFQNAGRGSGADTALQAPSRSVPAQRVALPFQVTQRLVFLPCGSAGGRGGGALLVEGVIIPGWVPGLRPTRGGRQRAAAWRGREQQGPSQAAPPSGVGQAGQGAICWAHSGGSDRFTPAEPSGIPCRN